MEKHKEIKSQLQMDSGLPKTTNITKMVSEAWRSLSPLERAKYEDMAREDKARYDVERASYKVERGSGASNKKKQRDPSAPKRPMSAFLAYANSRRAEVKAQNPECSNGEISKLLSDKWKEAPDSIKQKYRDDEAALWAAYKEEMQGWRKKHDGRKRGSKALAAAATLKQTSQKRNKSKSRSFDEETSIADNSFDDPHFSGFGAQGLDSASSSNQDDIMAASMALRGVRSGPSAFQFSVGAPPPTSSHMGVMDGGLSASVNSIQQNHQQGVGGNYSALFGMPTINNYGNAASNFPGNSVTSTNNFSQDIGSSNTNRSLMDIGFPYQEYGSYHGIFGNNSQAMLMAQAALRSNPGAYLGYNDQQASLSQLASLAGSQNSASTTAQSPVSMGMGLGLGMTGGGNGTGGLSGIGGIGGVAGMSGLNDSSNSRLGSDGMMNNVF